MTGKHNPTVFTATLARRVAQQTGLSQAVVRQVLGASLESVQAALAAGEQVTLPGFGTFYTAERQTAHVRSVRDGRQLTIPARRVAAFRVGAVLKRAVAGPRPRRRRLFGLAR
jgi:DNA-binding protein HU-beta